MTNWKAIRQEAKELIACAGPGLVIGASVGIAGVIGAATGPASWWLALPMMLAGCATGWARDQAAARATSKANGLLIKALTTGSDTNITVTFLDERPAAPSKEGE